MLFSILLLASTPQEPQPTEVDCSYDLEEMLALDLDTFDQDLDGGWRPLSMQGCHAEAAELIREWRYEKRAHNSILYWHEGQMRAFAGQTDEALALFALTYKPADLDADFGWNHYVDGTIAFLRRDRERLALAMERLAEVPEPDDLTATMPDGTVVTMSWPPNMNVLQAFDHCWEETYSDAYGDSNCRGSEAESE
ncbi:hypothetical protein [Aurantiacibacter sp. D1-12]|uniref:hypothetical protein n=1 Tax=Aurantiacibacter sp. D1-12 TaxID=2993658 RepID=UPI00237C9BCE|nr:hypothetical protein [Aurantiacibacter sp. D1-12]MDE1468065.1 hypothetical protein [Aurantiacibacter sp. D1-12]